MKTNKRMTRSEMVRRKTIKLIIDALIVLFDIGVIVYAFMCDNPVLVGTVVFALVFVAPTIWNDIKS